MLDQVQHEARERYALAAGKERDKLVRENIDCTQLLASLSHSHKLNLDLYSVTAAKDGKPRIQCGSRALSATDFLTKELGLDYRDSVQILRTVYERQVHFKEVQPRGHAGSGAKALWKEFKQGHAQHNSTVSAKLKAFNSTLTETRKALRADVSAQKKAVLKGLTGADRKAATAMFAVTAAGLKAELDLKIQAQRDAIRAEFQHQEEKAWRLFLQDKAEKGHAAALKALRSLDASEREKNAHAITGKIIIDDDEAEHAHAVAQILKSFSLNRTIATNGDLTYYLNGRPTVRDEGPRLRVLDAADPQVIEASLKLAAAKFGSELTLSGSEDFQRRCVEIAVQRHLPVRFANPDMEAYRAQLVEHDRQSRLPRPAPSPAPVVAPAAQLADNKAALERWLADNNVVALPADPGKTYHGPILYVDPTFAVQDVGRTQVIHDLNAETLDLTTKDVGTKVTITVAETGLAVVKRESHQTKTKGPTR